MDGHAEQEHEHFDDLDGGSDGQMTSGDKLGFI